MSVLESRTWTQNHIFATAVMEVGCFRAGGGQLEENGVFKEAGEGRSTHVLVHPVREVVVRPALRDYYHLYMEEGYHCVSSTGGDMMMPRYEANAATVEGLGARSCMVLVCYI